MTLEQAKEAAKNKKTVWYTDNDGKDHEASVIFATEDIAEIEFDGRCLVVGLEEIQA